jgi:hypothetical protein
MSEPLVSTLGDDPDLADQIVGSAGMHGFQTIGQAARRVEEAAAGGNAELIAATIRELRELSARARAR